MCVRQHRVLFAYKSGTDDWIFIIFTSNIDIDEKIKLTQGQGHKVKGQGKICYYVKKLVLIICNELMIAINLNHYQILVIHIVVDINERQDQTCNF